MVIFLVLLREAKDIFVSHHCGSRKHRTIAGNLTDLRVEKFKQKGDKQAEAWTCLFFLIRMRMLWISCATASFFAHGVNSGSLLNKDSRKKSEGLACMIGPTLSKAQALDLLAGVYLASNEKDEVMGATFSHFRCFRRLIAWKSWQALKLAEESLALFREVSSHILIMKEPCWRSYMR